MDSKSPNCSFRTHRGHPNGTQKAVKRGALYAVFVGRPWFRQLDNMTVQRGMDRVEFA